ncbi:unnamed protein product [Anisakis simplex]|uniref:ShKT domain-containing protein n=1 Tax=Anisakis simplex TaxID=6269 RepID=A0A0M3J1E8_ANISI|nr:unnamed protein product [Anisakis simplex]
MRCSKTQMFTFLVLSVVLIGVLTNAEECEDLNKDCADRKYLCTDYKDYAAKNCRKSCDLCEGGGGGGGGGDEDDLDDLK